MKSKKVSNFGIKKVSPKKPKVSGGKSGKSAASIVNPKTMTGNTTKKGKSVSFDLAGSGTGSVSINTKKAEPVFTVNKAVKTKASKKKSKSSSQSKQTKAEKAQSKISNRPKG